MKAYFYSVLWFFLSLFCFVNARAEDNPYKNDLDCIRAIQPYSIDSDAAISTVKTSFSDSVAIIRGKGISGSKPIGYGTTATPEDGFYIYTKYGHRFVAFSDHEDYIILPPSRPVHVFLKNDVLEVEDQQALKERLEDEKLLAKNKVAPDVTDKTVSDTAQELKYLSASQDKTGSAIRSKYTKSSDYDFDVKNPDDSAASVNLRNKICGLISSATAAQSQQDTSSPAWYQKALKDKYIFALNKCNVGQETCTNPYDAGQKGSKIAISALIAKEKSDLQKGISGAVARSKGIAVKQDDRAARLNQ